jgi:hypothetical protein
MRLTNGLREVGAGDAQAWGCRRRRVDKRPTGSVEDEDPATRGRELLDESVAWPQLVRGVDVLRHGVRGVVGVRDQRRIKRLLELGAKRQIDAGAERDEGGCQEPGVDEGQPGPDRHASPERAHSLRT